MAVAVTDEAFQDLPYSADQDFRVTEKLEGEIHERRSVGSREGHPTILYEVMTKHGEQTESIISGSRPIFTFR